MVGPSVFRGYDQAGLDAQYNNRARIPEHPAILARWAALGVEVRTSLDAALDLPYGDGDRERLDIFRPSAPATSVPIFFYVHGGYWQGSGKSDVSYLAPAFTRAGAVFVAPGYSLAPAVTMDVIVDQVREALLWTHRHAREFGGDPERIHVAGFSAGGHLAAMLLATDWTALAAPADVLKTVTCVSGLYDLEPIRLSYLNAVLGLDSPAARRSSPVHNRPLGKAPLLVAVGGIESDEYHRQARDLAAAWSPHLSLSSLELPGCNHFMAQDALGDAGHPLHRTVRERMGLLADSQAKVAPVR
jgi:arylformamidase